MNIKAVMKEKRITLDELAERYAKVSGCMITRSAMSQTVNGNPTVKKLELLAELIGCKVGDFFKEEMTEKENKFSKLVCPNCGKVLTVKTEIV